MNKNKLIKDFMSDLNKYITKLDKISKKVHSLSKNSKINGKFNEFIKYLLDNFENSKIQEYFFSVVRKADKEANSSLSYKELCVAEYLCEFILFVKIVLYDKEEDIPFDKKILIKKFFDIFGEDKNTIEISVINLKEEKKTYILVSFLAILFKNYKGTNIIDTKKLERNRQAINGLMRFYPSLMKKIVEKKKSIKASPGEVIQLKIKNKGKKIPIKKFKWKSSNKKLATVKNGKVKVSINAKKGKKVKILAKLGGIEKYITIKIK
jgi:hypothetical protein